jgi:uncharacterized protein
MEERFERERVISAPIDVAFAYHARPGALERLVPPWERVEVLRRDGGVGDRGSVELRLDGLLRWRARHTDYDPPHLFRDEQERGPFARWVHTHRFAALDAQRTRLTDTIDYRLPLGGLGKLVAGRYVQKRLERTFAYRHAVTAMDLERIAWAAPMGTKRIAVSGASGLIGKALSRFLTLGGHTVVPLVRRAGRGIHWDPETGEIDHSALEGFDAVVHLAGEPVANPRWTKEFREAALKSRKAGTALIARAIARLERPPAVFVSANGIGTYGDRDDEWLDENASQGSGFLADVCAAWEDAAAYAAPVRTVVARIGLVLDTRSGPLSELVRPFRWGVGGSFGHGRQFMSWIGIDDVVGALHRAIFDDALRGPVNFVTPNPVRNSEFARILGRVLRRPTFIGVPAWALRLMLGAQKAQELVLGGQRVRPARLESVDFQFAHRELEPALRHLFGR